MEPYLYDDSYFNDNIRECRFAIEKLELISLHTPETQFIYSLFGVTEYSQLLPAIRTRDYNKITPRIITRLLDAGFASFRDEYLELLQQFIIWNLEYNINLLLRSCPIEIMDKVIFAILCAKMNAQRRNSFYTTLWDRCQSIALGCPANKPSQLLDVTQYVIRAVCGQKVWDKFYIYYRYLTLEHLKVLFARGLSPIYETPNGSVIILYLQLGRVEHFRLCCKYINNWSRHRKSIIDWCNKLILSNPELSGIYDECLKIVLAK